MMDNTPIKLRFPGLTPLDRKELEKSLPSESITFDDQQLDEGLTGEPITTTVVILISVIALKGILSWLLKNRLIKRFEKTVETVAKDGTITRTTIKVNLKSSTAAVDILKQLNVSDDVIKSLLDLL